MACRVASFALATMGLHADPDQISHQDVEPNESDQGSISASTPMDFKSAASASRDRHIFYGDRETLTYDDNVFTSTRDKNSDVYLDSTLSLAAGLGHFIDHLQDLYHLIPDSGGEDADAESYLFAQWSPDWIYFIHNTDQNRINQDISISGTDVFGKLQTDVSLHAQTLSDTVTDVAARTDRSIFAGLLSSRYSVAPKTDLGSSVSYENDHYHGRLSIDQWNVSLKVEYDLASKTKVGSALSYGEMTVHPGSSQFFEQGIVRCTYFSSDKLRFDGNLGGETRTLAHNMDRRASLIFNVAATYQLGEQTEANLSVARATRGTAENPDENVIETSYQIDLHTRLYQKLSTGISGGFRKAVFYATNDVVFAPRDDRYTFISGTIAFDFTQHGNVRLFYEHRENNSSAFDLSFAQNRMGIETNFIF